MENTFVSSIFSVAVLKCVKVLPQICSNNGGKFAVLPNAKPLINGTRQSTRTGEALSNEPYSSGVNEDRMVSEEPDGANWPVCPRRQTQWAGWKPFQWLLRVQLPLA